MRARTHAPTHTSPAYIIKVWQRYRFIYIDDDDGDDDGGGDDNGITRSRHPGETMKAMLMSHDLPPRWK